MKRVMNNDTIAGIASGMGGGIGILRVSGEKALSVVGEIFRTPGSVKEKKKWDPGFFYQQKSHTIHYGYILDGDSIVDEVIVLLMKAPNSYTKEDVIEIDSHGGAYVVQKIFKLLLKKGVRSAEPGEFTKRAFLNGRIDLSQAEAVMKMISSQNDFALKSAVQQLKGTVSQYIEEIRQEILHDMSYIEAALDDPEHISLEGFGNQLLKRTEQQILRLDQLLDHFDDGRMRSEGINTVIVGKPNAGKSSLMNLLLDEDRAIVTEIPGTTRDLLEEKITLGNIILNLVDTAGIHDTEDLVENIGVEKAVAIIQKADFIIYVVDSSRELEEADDKIIELVRDKQGVFLLNKADLPSSIVREDVIQKLPWHCISFSNKTGEGLKELEDYITDTFLRGDISYNDQVYLTSLRHREAVESGVVSLTKLLDTIKNDMPEDFYTIDMMDAYRKLGLINGETASEDMINKIFQEFCMGK